MEFSSHNRKTSQHQRKDRVETVKDIFKRGKMFSNVILVVFFMRTVTIETGPKR